MPATQPGSQVGDSGGTAAVTSSTLELRAPVLTWPVSAVYKEISGCTTFASCSMLCNARIVGNGARVAPEASSVTTNCSRSDPTVMPSMVTCRSGTLYTVARMRNRAASICVRFRVITWAHWEPSITRKTRYAVATKTVGVRLRDVESVVGAADKEVDRV